MSILELAKRDWKQYTTDKIGGFGVDITFIAPDMSTVQIVGLASKHHFQIDPETGIPVNAKNIHCSIFEKDLTDLGYPVRNNNDEVYLKKHKVIFTDSASIEITFIIDEWYQDETLGIIVCKLGTYE